MFFRLIAISLLAILISIKQSIAGHIYSADIQINYDFNGQANQYILIFKLQNGLSSQDWIRVTWPYNLGTYDTVLASLFVYSNNLRLASNLPSDSNSQNFQYFFGFNTFLTANIWYKLVLSAPISTTPAYINQPVQMHTLSTPFSSSILYDLNLAFGQLYLAPAIATSTLGVAVSFPTGLTIQNQAQAIYDIYIDITPTITQATGAIINVYIDKGSNIDGSTGTTNNQDFQFLGACQSIYASSTILPVFSSCKINDNLNSFIFNHIQGYTAGTTLRIKSKVYNPTFVSTRDIKVYVSSNTDGRTIEKGQVTAVISVASINLQLGSQKLLWGISISATISEIPVKIFKQQASGVAGPLNSLYFGFMAAQAVPIGLTYTLELKVGATGVLENSIVTNLPSADNTNVNCSYDTTNLILKCVNVGSLLYANPYEYFIALKAFYSSSASNPTNYGGVTIKSIVYDNSGVLKTGIYLFNAVTGDNQILYSNTEYLDTTGWHSDSQYGLGTTQVVSYYDDGTLQATPNGIVGFLTGTSSSVGIFPQATVQQQLLFFLKVPVAQISAAPTAATYTKMSILFNTDVISFNSGYANSGIDMAAYSATSSTWKVQSFQCFSQSTCVWFNQAVQTQANTIAYTTNQAGSRNYGLVTQECGLKATTGNAVSTKCDNFQGKGTLESQAGIISMRQVVFPKNYHASLYPDEQLLDFIVSFSSATVTGTTVGAYTVTSAQLIHGYTLNNAKMSNIKVSYVNYYGHTTVFNDGRSIPIMLRIGGSVLSNEHSTFTKIQVFFDQSIDSSTFYENVADPVNFQIGCSQATCQYFQAKNVVFPRDSWHTGKVFQITNLPNIENEFNILIPVTNTANTYPVSIVIAFLQQSKSSLGQIKDQVLTAFRVFGPVILNSVPTPIPIINGIVQNSDTSLTQAMTSNWKETAADSFNYQLDYNQISPSTNTNTKIYCNASSLTFTAGTSYGAGITLTSLYYDVFQFASAQFTTPPTNNPVCTKFSYTYNNPALTNKDKMKIYVLFCPVDSTFTLNAAAADISIINPSWSNYFVQNYPLSAVFTYALSQNTGKLIAIKRETGTVPTGSITCVSPSTTPAIYSNSQGLQRLAYSITLPQQLEFDNNGFKGFPSIKIVITLSTDITGLTFQSTCSVNSPSNAAQYITCVASKVTTAISLVLTTTTAFILQKSTPLIIYQMVSSQGQTLTPTTNVNYNVVINLPTYNSGTSLDQVFATSYGSTAPIFSQCTSGVFNISATTLGVSMAVTNLTYQYNEKNARSLIQFYFKASSFREIFFSFEQFIFDFGFITDPNTQLTTDNNFRCMVMDSDTQISWLWKQIIFSDLRNVILNPKADFLTPNAQTFIMKCIAGATPNNGASMSTDIHGKYQQPTAQIQATSPDVSYSTSIITTAKSFAVPLILLSKKFTSQGLNAFYSFQLQSTLPLTSLSRIYIEFPFGIPPLLNREGLLECYIKLTLTDNTTALCETIQERQLVVWFNQNLAANTNFYVDILGVTQPRNQDLKVSSSTIWIGIDQDNDKSNGISLHGNVVDSQPDITNVQSFPVLNFLITNNLVKQYQDIQLTVTLPGASVTATNSLYLDFPAALSYQLYRGMSATCFVYNLDVVSTTNYQTSCSFISKRRLQIIFAVDTNNAVNPQTYNITVKNIPTPTDVPDQINNQIRVVPFLASPDQRIATYIGIDYRINYISYQNDPTKVNLVWNFYLFSKNQLGQIVTNLDSVGTAEIYIGYYNKIIELAPQVANTKFSTPFSINFLNPDSFSFSTSTIQVQTGTTNTRFQIAAKQTTQQGVYILLSQKSNGDTKQIYTQPPAIQLTVKQVQCQINAAQASYTIPIGGQTLPIVFDFFNCFPVDDITIVPNLAGSPLIVIDTIINILTVKNTSSDTRAIFVIKQAGGANPTDGQSVTMTFTVTGTNAASFTAPSSINIVFAAVTITMQTNPIAAPIASKTIVKNTVSLSIGCDQPSTIYWVYGATDISSISLADIQGQLLTKTGFRQNYTDPADVFQWKVYGQDLLTAQGTIPKQFSKLKSNSSYNFKYYCQNQLQLVSPVMNTTMNIQSNGAYLLKLTLSFLNQLSYAQNNEIACSLAQAFSLQSSRVYSELAVYCGQSANTITVTDYSSSFVKSGPPYPYMYYILPDYSVESDFTNFQVRESISDKTFNVTLIDKTALPSSYPRLLEIESEDATTALIPTIETAFAVKPSPTAISLNILLKNVKGYIIVGVKQGLLDTKAPTVAMLKNGYYDTNNSTLVRVSMLFTASNTQQSFSFNGLTKNSWYTLYIYGTTDDPSQFAVSSDILNYTYITQDDSYQIIIGASILNANLWILIFFIITIIIQI